MVKLTLIQGDCQKVLTTLPDESVDCVMTSPPYWALRDYGVEKQLGLETTFQEYIIKLCDIFDEVKRILKKSGTCWVNIGDVYSTKSGSGFLNDNISSTEHTIKTGVDKSLCMIPFRFAIEMVNRGWILRNTIIWHKPNCMPSSTKDRFTVDFEYIFFFVKSKKYYFKTQYEPTKQTSIERMGRKWCGSKQQKYGITNNKQQIIEAEEHMDKKRWLKEEGRIKRTVWDISLNGFRGAHFAVYPEKLIQIPLEAGCPSNGTVLDPFVGSGTTMLVARKQGKSSIGIELNPSYIKIIKKRTGFNEGLCEFEYREVN